MMVSDIPALSGYFFVQNLIRCAAVFCGKKVMSRFRLFLLSSIFVLFSPTSLAWNTYGHLLVVELALDEIAPQKKRELDALAYSLVRQMESQKRLYLMRTFEGTSSVAHLATFPDEWRDLKLQELYDEYDQSMPISLAKYAESKTAHWHYINQVFTEDAVAASCSVGKEVDNPEQNIAVMLPKLIEAYQQADTPEDRSIAFAFILHLVGDAHNPLHAVTRVDNDCESDRGGNTFCATFRSASTACKESLHQAWDRGLGFFDEYGSIGEAVDFVGRVDVDEAAAGILDPNVWVEEGYDLARLVYSAQMNRGLDPYYISEGKIISYERIALAAKRLANIFDQL